MSDNLNIDKNYKLKHFFVKIIAYIILFCFVILIYFIILSFLNKESLFNVIVILILVFSFTFLFLKYERFLTYLLLYIFLKIEENFKRKNNLPVEEKLKKIAKRKPFKLKKNPSNQDMEKIIDKIVNKHIRR